MGIWWALVSMGISIMGISIGILYDMWGFNVMGFPWISIGFLDESHFLSTILKYSHDIPIIPQWIYCE